MQLDPVWQRFNTYRSGVRVPGGESMLDVQSRAVAELESIRLAYEGASVAIVSHAEWIRAALLFYLGMSLDLFARIEILPASVSTVDLAEWGPLIRGVNAL